MLIANEAAEVMLSQRTGQNSKTSGDRSAADRGSELPDPAPWPIPDDERGGVDEDAERTISADPEMPIPDVDEGKDG